MFSRVLSVFVLALPLLAAATVFPRGEPSNQCNGGSVQCCDSTQEASDSTDILQILGIAVPVQGVIGVTCTPITVLGTSNINCNQQTLCCNGDSFNGGYVTGCSAYNTNGSSK